MEREMVRGWSFELFIPNPTSLDRFLHTPTLFLFIHRTRSCYSSFLLESSLPFGFVLFVRLALRLFSSLLILILSVVYPLQILVYYTASA